MNATAHAIRDESRWPLALAVLAVVLLLAALPGHVFLIPVWVSHLAALAVLASMAAVPLTSGNALWLRIERVIIVLLAAHASAKMLMMMESMISLLTMVIVLSRALSIIPA